MSEKKPPIQSLTVFLIKTGTKAYEEALDEDEVRVLTRYELDSSTPFEGVVFLGPQQTAQPRWFDFLEAGVKGNLDRRRNSNTSSVLFIKSAKRILAFTFGYGRSWLRPNRIERGFGLRVVLNTVDEAGLRSVDTKTVQELTVHTRRQTSRSSRLSEFGVDKEEDLLGSVAGVPSDPAFARVVSGADALQFRASLEFGDLGAKCREVLNAYRSDSYKKRGFEFVDHVKTVTDPEMIGMLDEQLLPALRLGSSDGLHMAPPEIVDCDRIDGFSFVKSGAPEPDLSLGSLHAQIRSPENISIERLRRQRIFLHFAESAEPISRWSVYRALVAERDVKGRRYVLSGGEWHEIEKQFSKRIDNRVDRIPRAGLNLPSAKQGEYEGAYNKRAAGRGIYLLDKKCVRADGDQIELCDLYVSNDRQFVHVKRWNQSSTLSHLFAQARVSAEAFLSDEGFREEARVLLADRAASLAAHVPRDRPDPNRYRVVFAIIKGGPGWRRALPFFSKLHLVRSAESLRTLGFDVRLERIEVE
ncbi:MAG: DUF6119 family protein [Actinomycetota bacterium]